MNVFAISSLLVFIFNLLMAVFVFIKGRDRKLSIVWSFFCVIVATWGFGAYKFASATSKGVASFWWQIAFIGTITTPAIYFHFVQIITKLNKKYLIVLFYILTVIFLLINFFAKDLFVGNLRFVFNQFYWSDWYSGQKSVHLIFYIGFYWVLLSYSFLLLWKYYRYSTGLIRNQMKYVVVGMLIGWIGAECMFLPAFRIDIYPVANFLIVGYTIIITYAIIRHRLMDINIVIQKSFIYSILIALITATYFVFVFLAERFFQGMVGYTSLIMSILYAFVIALFFNPVKNKIQHLADRIFLGKDPLQIARENELLRQELERSEHLKAVATLASGMAHEIKNPLTAIKTFSEYLPQKYQDPQFLNKFSHLVTEQVDKIDNLVHQLLDFAKPANLHLEQTDIHKLLDETLDLLSSDLLKHRIKLIKDYSDSKLISVIDANQIKQVFLNLFLNAIEAMTSGGTLSIKTESNHSNQDKITVIIADTGIGIADKDLPHIFEPFYSTKKEGTGLGLSIVYNIIKEHKGTIRAESKVNEGTKFIIELPRTQK